ncbi:transporter [Couchioplanes caeruleus subsp. caeruleus]|uniref:Transporter n=1 Tax=Couchioplanes caeruleus subsp. caeruleus TaxID=56427 RepID=A0A1K0GNS6_9ACTN|nr:transporter [Couchioplanes caeruleus subsp. caeruleus]
MAVAALVLAAINLRPAVASLGPVLAEVRESLGMSATVAGLLTSVPALCFAVIGSTAPLLARRWGTAGAVAVGATALALGLAVRPWAGGTPLFLALTALAFAGIALANVLLPVVVKQWFPDRVGAMTGLYSVALNLGASAAAAVTVPLTGAFGGDWRLGLGVWAVAAALALPLWVRLARVRTGAHPRQGTAARPAGPAPRLWREPVAWALAVFFGLQSTNAYVIMGWLPQVFRDAGLSASTAGLLFAVIALLGVPLSFGLSAVAGRLPRQSGIAVGLGLFGLAGFAGLCVAPAAAPWVWSILLGISNCAFPLALTMIALRGRDAAVVARLSAFAQSTGYLLSIPGPVVVGALYQHSGSWRVPLALMAALMVPQMVAGYLAGRDRRIG